jgi:hypothetical protein
MSGKFEDWQVNQRNAAFRLYDYSLSMEHKVSRAGLLDAREEWKLVEEKRREVLRFRES